ncbi:hypothetical protein F5880DRAFT_1618559 [Lentinula raphanica]|nr:hypothetical protein F5880DRAFT_1618559 [Lentinula raphanica]
MSLARETNACRDSLDFASVWGLDSMCSRTSSGEPFFNDDSSILSLNFLVYTTTKSKALRVDIWSSIGVIVEVTFDSRRLRQISCLQICILAILCSVSSIFNVPFTAATYGLPRGRQPPPQPESHNEVPDDRFMREAILPPTPPPLTAPFPPPTAPPLPSIPPKPEAQRPIATYAFIQSPGPGSEGMQDSAAFMAELKTYSKAFIEDRIFRHIGITAKQDEDSNVEPLHSLINWGWNLTTKDAALVIARTVRLDTWRFMSASAVVAARVSEDDYWVVPTPIVVRVWLRSRDFEVYFDPDSQPLAPFPIPYDTNAIHRARFKVRYNPALDDPIDDSYAALLQLRGASLTHSDQH